jgi:Raf kinase inhibitor-like YbhB/YbcL family protein
MQLTSSIFTHQTSIPADYTCKGRNVSPPLRIEDTPPGTHSLVLIMHDPDAPGGDFTHWTLWNIPPTVADIPDGTAPAGSAQGVTSFGITGYGGPCPPSGTHRYMFDLYALDVSLNLPEGTQRQEVEAAMQNHIIGQTRLTGLVAA